jgi:putative thymidine phosphorylase
VFKFSAGRPIAFLHKNDATTLKVHTGERVLISRGSKSFVSALDITDDLFRQGHIALSEEAAAALDVSNGDSISVSLAPRPLSSIIIQNHEKAQQYSKKQLLTIVRDIVTNALTEAEISYFVSEVFHHGLSLEETANLTRAIFETGSHVTWHTREIADKHSIGGIPGNRTTPIVVSICAAAGVVMPKTSSRAITSAAGTADVVESIARVDFSLEELKRIVKKTNACLAWGGALGLAPADDKLIQVEKLLNLDPEPQLLASILAKKLAAGSKYVLIDIPAGPGAKVSIKEAHELGKKFTLLGNKLGLKIHVLPTDGKEPIGNGIGPMLEMRDVIKVLEQKKAPQDLEAKSLVLAGTILEMMRIVSKGKGQRKAQEILRSGQALAKFKEIIAAQHGSLNNIKEAPYKLDVKSTKKGIIKKIDNHSINMIGRIAGSPLSKTAGLYLYHHTGAIISKGQTLFTIHSESKQKLVEARDYALTVRPITLA